MVNHAYYTYQDPDNIYYDDSNKFEENDEYVIESMYKKREIEARRKNQ